MKEKHAAGTKFQTQSAQKKNQQLQKIAPKKAELPVVLPFKYPFGGRVFFYHNMYDHGDVEGV